MEVNSAQIAGITTGAVGIINVYLAHAGIDPTVQGAISLVATGGVYVGVNYLRDKHPHLVHLAELLVKQGATGNLLAGLQSGSIKGLKKAVAKEDAEVSNETI